MAAAYHQIPVDYSITKGRLGLVGGDLTAYDSDGSLLVFRVHSSGRVKTLLDASGTPLIAAASCADGHWQGFRGNSSDLQDLIFTVQRTLSSLCNAELEVFLVGEKFGQSRCRFRLKGNPFTRSCTMYLGDSIVAQSNFKYKLRKSIHSRHKFRLTIYPGIDHALVFALLVIFFW